MRTTDMMLPFTGFNLVPYLVALIVAFVMGTVALVGSKVSKLRAKLRGGKR